MTNACHFYKMAFYPVFPNVCMRWWPQGVAELRQPDSGRERKIYDASYWVFSIHSLELWPAAPHTSCPGVKITVQLGGSFSTLEAFGHGSLLEMAVFRSLEVKPQVLELPFKSLLYFWNTHVFDRLLKLWKKCTPFLMACQRHYDCHYCRVIKVSIIGHWSH